MQVVVDVVDAVAVDVASVDDALCFVAVDCVVDVAVTLRLN